LKKIFSAFEKLNYDMNSKGMGLGLSISNDYSKLIHSYIKVNSKKGKGSTFSFFIPYGDTKKDITIKKNTNLTHRVSVERLNLNTISKQDYKKIKSAIARLYYSELKEIFTNLDDEIKNTLINHLNSFKWEELRKIFK